MKKISLLIFSSFLFLMCYNQNYNKFFTFFSNDKKSIIVYDTNDYKLSEIVANCLADDISLITNYRPKVVTTIPNNESKDNIIFIGSINKSKILKDILVKYKINVNEIKDKWECYKIKLVNERRNKILIIAGSDRRGVAYGVFNISEKIGVSPWYWWADVIPEKRNNLTIQINDTFSNSPSVKYRGIFLNDEDWGLQPWAAKTYEKETGDIGPKTYAKIFELILRLKGNLIWPAMHSCTKAFYYYKENPIVADNYGIIVGSSHAEPMLRNNVDEWDKTKRGEYNYVINRENVLKYWEERVIESSKYENIYTLGMRGIHDSGMEGVKNAEDKVIVLKNIIEDQRNLLKKYVDNNISIIPQCFIPYKEVLEVVEKGLQIPDDIIIVWPDDNYGYIRTLNTYEYSNRKGGSGVYYHISYWGRPHDYLWLSTTHPILIYNEMKKAYITGAKKLWIVNVGDIKPAEYNIQLFLDMAWNINIFKTEEDVLNHMIKWYSINIDKKYSEKIAKMYLEYYNLAFQRRPEFMGFNQTEPTRKVNFSNFNHFKYGDEAYNRLKKYYTISIIADSIYNLVPKHRKDAYYQLVYYPVISSYLMNKKFISFEKSILYSQQYRKSSNDYALNSKLAYDSIKLITENYNKKISAGKWNFMMNMNPRKLPVFDPLPIPQWEINYTCGWGISTEGNNDIRKTNCVFGNTSLPVFNINLNQTYFIDLYLINDDSVNWKAKTSHKWIELNKYNGSLNNMKKEDRVYVKLNKSFYNQENNGYIIFNSKNISYKIDIVVNNKIPDCDNCFIEDNKIISIYAENYNKIDNNGKFKWQVLKYLGYSGASLQSSFDEIFENNKSNIPSFVEYDIFSYGSGKANIYFYCIPVHPINSNFSLKFSVFLNNKFIDTLDCKLIIDSDEWKESVLRNYCIVKTYCFIEKGVNKLRIGTIDPGVIIDRIIISLSPNLIDAYGLINETKYKKPNLN